MLLSDAIQRFYKWKALDVIGKTINRYEDELRQFCVYMRNCHIEQITIDDVANFFDMLRALNYRQNSFTTKSIALRKFFDFFHRQGLPVLDPNLIPVAKREYVNARIATEEEYQKLLQVIPRCNDKRHIRNKSMVTMLWDTGMRAGELLSLDVRDVDMEKMKAVIKTEKAQKSIKPIREVFWTRTTNDALHHWITYRGVKKDNALYVAVSNSQAGHRLTLSALGIMLRHYSTRAKIPYLNAHSFRHHFGLDLAMKNANNSMISNLMGHQSLSSSFRYTQMNDQDLEQVYRRMKGA